jgi:hypothetical protein
MILQLLKLIKNLKISIRFLFQVITFSLSKMNYKVIRKRKTSSIIFLDIFRKLEIDKHEIEKHFQGDKKITKSTDPTKPQVILILKLTDSSIFRWKIRYLIYSRDVSVFF